MTRTFEFGLLAIAVAGCSPSMPAAGGASTPSPQASADSRGGWSREVSGIPVADETDREYAFPFLGGFNVPRPQFIDIDGDGDYDLFVQERTGELIFFENTGTSKAARYTWRTDRYQDLHIGEWTRFVDLDGDGDFDMLAEQPYSYIRWFRNDGSRTAARFVLVADSVRDADGKALFSDRQNIPNLVDIDCNGRIDLFLGRVDGTITRYEIVPGGETPRFRFVTDRFEDISIVAQMVGSARHGANTMYFADADGDGDSDLFWGDFFEPGVLFIENHGSCTAPSLRAEPVPVTATNDSVKTSGYNVPVIVDIDADGDLDFFVGVLGGAYNPNRTSADNLYYSERTPDGLALRTQRYLATVDIGSESMTSLADLDGDGDLDLIVANKIDALRLDRSRLFRFENTGTAKAPRFALRDTLDFRIAYHEAPAFADLDGDGDLDMLLGTWNTGIAWYRNDGSRTAAKLTLVDSAFVTLTRGSNPSPALGDIDGDGDLDLFVGESSGELNFYRNEGSRTEPGFVLVDENFDRIDAGRRSYPTLVDIDGDGDLDLVLGSEDGGAQLYRNEGSRTEPRFVRDAAFNLPLPNFSTPAFADIDGDGDLDIFSGGLGGGVTFLRNNAKQD